jgi:hypothetical protein
MARGFLRQKITKKVKIINKFYQISVLRKLYYTIENTIKSIIQGAYL